jgi:Protein of unknown function (DUF1761)
MTFDGINYLAVLTAAVGAWVLAIVWYQTLIKQWLARQGKTDRELGPRSYPKPYVLWVFVVQLIMARILADVVIHGGDVAMGNGIMWGGLCFLGFVGPVMVTSSYLHGRKGMLGAIEFGYWFVALALMGAIIGAFGAD